MTDHMTDTIQETHDETPPKKKSVTRQILLALLLAASPWLLSDRIPWSWLDHKSQQLRFVTACGSVEELHRALATGMPIDEQGLGWPFAYHVVFNETLAPQQRDEVLLAFADAGGDVSFGYPFSPLILLLHKTPVGWKETGKLLIERGKGINNRGSGSENRSVVEQFFRCGLAPNSDEFNTSEKIIPNAHWKEIIAWLIENGVDKDRAMYFAMAESASPEVVSWLLELGADPDSGKKSVICYVLERFHKSIAYWRSSPEIVQILLDAGADVNHGDEGSRPLLSAVRRCCEHNLEVITKLLEAGADPSFRSSRGVPIIEFARENEALQGTPEMEALEKAVAAANLASDTEKR